WGVQSGAGPGIRPIRRGEDWTAADAPQPRGRIALQTVDASTPVPCVRAGSRGCGGCTHAGRYPDGGRGETWEDCATPLGSGWPLMTQRDTLSTSLRPVYDSACLGRHRSALSGENVG